MSVLTLKKGSGSRGLLSGRNPLARGLGAFGGLLDNVRGRTRRGKEVFSFPAVPAVDVSEDDKEMVIKAEVPGLSEKDLQVAYENGCLTIRGQKQEESEDRGKDSFYRESWYGAFHRSIPVGENVDWEHARARYRNGVLRVTLPRRAGGAKKANITIE